MFSQHKSFGLWVAETPVALEDVTLQWEAQCDGPMVFKEMSSWLAPSPHKSKRE